MNCKQGDLAVIVSSISGHEGKIVRCVKFVMFNLRNRGLTDCWITEPMLPNREGAKVPCMDSQLRPIRDNDGEDETLQWAPVPTKETA